MNGLPAETPPIRPLEILATQPGIPVALIGQQGLNRADPARRHIAADDDLTAVAAFLNEYRHSPHTHAAYRKECERLLLWAVLERGKPLSSLDRQDFDTYLTFLGDPQPAARWCGPRRPRHSPEWRPFIGPLGPAARIAALAAIQSLMSWLVDAGYLAANPLGLMRQARRQLRPAYEEQPKVERFLDRSMWRILLSTIESLPRETEREAAIYERARWLVALLMLLAPRAGELERHTMGSFRESRGRWWWHVVGKGAKASRVPVPDALLEALMRYRRFLGFPPLPTPEDTIPLLCSLKGTRPITARRFNQILQSFFEAAAQRVENERPDQAAKFRAASAHWGRHTSITALVDGGLDRCQVQRLARHGDTRTTDLYIHEEEEALHEAVRGRCVDWNLAVKG